MPTKHTIRPGECIASVARQYGMLPESLWLHPDNTDLRNQRTSGDLLKTGDEVTVPDLHNSTQSGKTDKLHRFRHLGKPCWLRLQMIHHGEVRKKERFELIVGADTITGETDSEGLIQVAIDPAITEAQLEVGEDRATYTLYIGYLQGVSDVAGVQARLTNLGFVCGQVDGILGPLTETAIEDFQYAMKLEASGELTQDTLDALERVHDTMDVIA